MPNPELLDLLITALRVSTLLVGLFIAWKVWIVWDGFRQRPLSYFSQRELEQAFRGRPERRAMYEARGTASKDDLDLEALHGILDAELIRENVSVGKTSIGM